MEKEKDNLYLIKMSNKSGDVMIKLGYSSNIDKRLKTYYYHNPLIEVIKTFYSEDAKIIEKEIHSKIQSCCLNEWYTEDKLDEIIKILNSYNVLELDCFSLKYRGEDMVTYVGDGLSIDVLKSIKPNHLKLLARLSLDLDRETNSIPILKNKIIENRIANHFKIDKRGIKNIIENFISVGIIKKKDDDYIMNPNFYNKSRTLNPMVWKYFNLNPPTSDRYV